VTSDRQLEVAAWAQSPNAGKTVFTIYVGQASLAAGFGHYLFSAPTYSTTVLLAFIAAIALVAITGIVGLGWTDPAVRMASVIKGAPEGSTVRADAGPPASVAITPNGVGPGGPSPG
jgi:hypothetical protein